MKARDHIGLLVVLGVMLMIAAPSDAARIRSGQSRANEANKLAAEPNPCPTGPPQQYCVDTTQAGVCVCGVIAAGDLPTTPTPTVTATATPTASPTRTPNACQTAGGSWGGMYGQGASDDPLCFGLPTATVTPTTTAQACGANQFVNALSNVFGATCAAVYTPVATPTALAFTNQQNVFAAGAEQVFQASASKPGVRHVGVAVDPSPSPSPGSAWYRDNLAGPIGTPPTPAATPLGRLRVRDSVDVRSVAYTDDIPQARVDGTVVSQRPTAHSYSGADFDVSCTAAGVCTHSIDSQLMRTDTDVSQSQLPLVLGIDDQKKCWGTSGEADMCLWFDGAANKGKISGTPAFSEGASIPTGQTFVVDSGGRLEIAGTLELEGATVDSSEITIAAEDPTFDVTVTVPAMTGKVPLVLFTATANAGPSNTTSETSVIGSGVGSLTIPANGLRVGRVIRITIQGVMKTAASAGTLTWRIKLGSTLLHSRVGTLTNDIAADRPLTLTVFATVRTTGASGTAWTGAEWEFNPSAFGTAEQEWLFNGVTQPVTIDTTASAAVDVTAQFGTQSVDNYITGTGVIVELLN